MDEVDRMRRSLKCIDAIVDAYVNGKIKITSDKNGLDGYLNGNEEVGLDVIMAIIRNYVIGGLYMPTQEKGVYLYV